VTSTLDFAVFSFERNLKCVSRSPKISQTGSHIGFDDPKRFDQIKIIPFIQTSLDEDQSGRPRKPLYVYSMSLFMVGCLSDKQMDRSEIKVSIKEVQRLDHTTKLEVSLPRQYHLHWT
jgi:hypothetical protein